MAQAVTELVVRGDGALAVLDRFERGMENAGRATDQTTGAVADFERRMAAARDAIERGNAITTQSIERKTAEQRAWDRWSATVDKTTAMRIRLERESANAAVAAANAVNLGYATQEQALSTLMALEARHAAQLQGVTDQHQRAAQTANAAAAANDNLARSFGRTSAAAQGTGFQTANVAAQFQDIAVTAQMGMNPLMIALQQGTQLSAVLTTMQNPLRGLAAAFMSVINPISLATIAFVGITAAALQWAGSLLSGSGKATDALKEHGKALDEILKGYDAAREAADKLLNREMAKPAISVLSGMEVYQVDALQAYEEALVRIIQRQSELQGINDLILQASGDPAAVRMLQGVLDVIDEIGLSVNTTTQDFDRLHSALTTIANTSQDLDAREHAATMLEFVEGAMEARAIAVSTGAAVGEMRKAVIDAFRFPFGNGDGISDALDRVRSKTVDLRTEQERLADQFAMDMLGARTIGDVQRLVQAYDDLNRAARASAWAIANSGDAAAVAAGQYGTAAGAANAYANAMWRLGSLIPEVAAAQTSMLQLKSAGDDYKLAVKAANEELALGSINQGAYNEKVAAASDLLARARDQVTGLTDVTRDLEDAERQAYIGSLPARQAAEERIRDAHAARVKAVEQSIARGMDAVDAEEAIARSAAVMGQEIVTSNRHFDEMAAKSSGAAKALRAAEKDFNSFISTADKLAEALFPGEYARKEAMELQAALATYGNALTDLQRVAVEAEIGDLFKASELGVRRLEDQTKKSANNMADTLQKTLGAALKDIFTGGIKDANDLFERLAQGFDGIANQNFENLFGFMNGVGEAGQPQMQKTIEKAVETGGFKGVFSAFDEWFGQASGQNGAGFGGSMLGAGLGGFSTGYQAADPLMGGLGGAVQGAGAGMAFGPMGMAIGAVIGGLGGVIGGLFGMNKALQEAQEKLAKVRNEIESFLDVGEGTGLGKRTQELREYYDKSYEYQELAMKAGDGALQRRLQEAANSFFFFVEKDFKLGYEGTIQSLSSGQGLGGAFVTAQQSMIGLRDELKGFIADIDYIGNKALGVEDDPATAARVLEAQQAAQTYVLSLLSGVDALTETERAVQEAEGKASALQVTLEQLGMSAEDAASAIMGALGMAMAKLRDEYARDINASINELSGFGFINEIVEAQVKYQERLRDAAALGLDGASAMQELGLSLAGIARSAGLTQSQIDMLAQTFPAMAGMLADLADNDARRRLSDAQAALRAAYEAQARALETTINRLDRFITSVQKFRDNLRLDDNLSPLNPQERLIEAQRQFQTIMAQAMGGGEGAEEAMGRVEDVSRAYLEAARDYYGTSTQYFAIFENVEGLLDSVLASAKTQLSDAQMQLSVLREQVGALISIDNGVQSVADAIANLAAAQAASDAMLAAQLGQLAMANTNAISAVYQSVLGRDPDAGGLAYYNNQMNQGKTIGQVTDSITNSNERQLQSLYETILGRRGDAEGLAYWSREMDRGITIDQIAAEFARNKALGLYFNGGYTGDGATNAVAGLVHRGEYVFDAASTSRIGLQNLDALRMGRSGNDNGSSALVQEVRALRQQVARLESGQDRQTQVTAAGAQAQVAAAGQTTQEVAKQSNAAWRERHARRI